MNENKPVRVWTCTNCSDVTVLLPNGNAARCEADKDRHLANHAWDDDGGARFVEWHPEWPATEPVTEPALVPDWLVDTSELARDAATVHLAGGIDTKARGLELAIEWTKDDPGVTLPRVLEIATAFEAHLETVNAEIVEADQ